MRAQKGRTVRRCSSSTISPPNTGVTSARPTPLSQTLRHRTKRVKGALICESALSMMLQLGLEAQKRWRRVTGAEKLAQLIEGVQFKDGTAQLAA
jgi:hypothetical protein